MSTSTLRPSPFLEDAITNSGYHAPDVEATEDYLAYLRHNGGSGLHVDIIKRWVLSSKKSPLTALLSSAQRSGIPAVNILAVIAESALQADHVCGNIVPLVADPKLPLFLRQQIGSVPSTPYDQIHQQGAYKFSKQTSPGPLAQAAIEVGLVENAKIAIDLGTGNARDVQAMALANPHLHAVGVDSSDSILKSAERRIASIPAISSRVSLVHGELHHLVEQRPDLRQSADLVNASSVLHLEPRSKFVQTLTYIRQHLLRRGGAVGLLHKTPRCARNSGGLLLEQWSDSHAGARVCDDGISRWFDEHENLLESVEAAGYRPLPQSKVASYSYASDTPDEFSVILAQA